MLSALRFKEPIRNGSQNDARIAWVPSATDPPYGPSPFPSNHSPTFTIIFDDKTLWVSFNSDSCGNFAFF